MSIRGTVPAALAGTVNSNGVRQGIFDETIIANKKYVTRLTFVNVPQIFTKGTNGFGGQDIYDFGKGLMRIESANIALTIVVDPTKVTEGANKVLVGLGVATATDVVAGSATNNEVILIAYTGTTSTVTEIADARTGLITSLTGGSGIGTPFVIDGTATAKSLFLNWNVVAANLSGTTVAQLVNGTVELHYEDLGGDL